MIKPFHSTLSKISFLVILITVSFSTDFLYAAEQDKITSNSRNLTDSKWTAKIKQAISEASNSMFDNGLKIAQSYIDADPQGCESNFFFQSLLYEKIQRLNDRTEKDRFYKYSDRTIKYCMKKLKKDPKNINYQFFLGTSYGYKSLIKIKFQSYMSSLRLAIKARKILEEIRAVDPNFADNNYALGLLYFYTSVMANRSGGIVSLFSKMFILKSSDRTDEGLNLIIYATENDAVAKPYADFSLMWAYLVIEKFDQAEKLSAQLIKKYPNDEIGRWVNARALYEKNDCKAAAEAFKTIETNLARKGHDVEKKFDDVTIAKNLAESCLAEQNRDYSTARAINKRVTKWLLDEESIPVASIEYQSESLLFTYWHNKIKAAEARMAKEATKPVL